jgi:hypothetical protein
MDLHRFLEEIDENLLKVCINPLDMVDDNAKDNLQEHCGKLCLLIGTLTGGMLYSCCKCVGLQECIHCLTCGACGEGQCTPCECWVSCCGLCSCKKCVCDACTRHNIMRRLRRWYPQWDSQELVDTANDVMDLTDRKQRQEKMKTLYDGREKAV